MKSQQAINKKRQSLGTVHQSAGSEVGRLVSAFWGVAELLRGDFKPFEYQDVILPLVFLLRIDGSDPLCGREVRVLQHDDLKKRSFAEICHAAKTNLDEDLEAEIAKAIGEYLAQISASQQALLQSVGFNGTVDRLREAKLLRVILVCIADVSGSVQRLSNQSAGELYESLLNKFAEFEGETAGEHFTPREVIELMANLLYVGGVSTQSSSIRLYDPACGVGGMLEIAASILGEKHQKSVEVFGQELNPRTHALAEIIRTSGRGFEGQVECGNTLSSDAFPNRNFELMIANPPFGVDWRKVERQIRREASELGSAGRFSAGLPRVSDGSLLFLQHLISKMRPESDGGARIAILFSGSPLFSGTAGSGESRIRQWILANDLLEGVVALPDSIFLNTTVSTYMWILTNVKQEGLEGAIRLVDARHRYKRLSRNIGSRRNQITEQDLGAIVADYCSTSASPTSRSIRACDCLSLRVPVQLTFPDLTTEVENISIPCPTDITLDELGEGGMSDEKAQAYVDAYLAKNYSAYGVDTRADFARSKVACEIPFKSFFFVDDVRESTVSLISVLDQLNETVMGLDQGDQ